MAQRLQLRLKQQLAMAPQLQQAIKLLQLGRVELRDYIQEALDSNPLLEQEGAESVDPEFQNEFNDEAEAWLNQQGIPGDNRKPGDSTYLLDSLPDPEEENLRGHLLWQINLTPFSAQEEAIAKAIVFGLDEDGYLADSLTDIRQALLPEHTVQEEDIQAVLSRVQRMEPVGVACRNARETIQVQLSALSRDIPGREIARRLAGDHLDLLVAGDKAALMDVLAAAEDQVELAVDLIQSLEPRPGARYDNRADEYIVPDVYFLPDGDDWRASLNPDNEPRLQLNKYYVQLLRAEGKKESEYLQGHLREAHWLMNALLLRNRSLMLVAEAIVKHQRDFLEQGEVAMRPLVLREIATKTGLHESTVSRATTRKYAFTPRGIFELKYFFSSHVKTRDGQSISSVAVKACLAALVESEEPGKPLSDQQLSDRLAASGIRIARRTVAKYREALGIGSSSERRQQYRRQHF